VIRLKWKLDSVRMEIVLILVQDRYTVCDERTTSSEIILDTPKNSLQTWIMWNLVLVRLEILLVSVSVQERCTVCAKHSLGLEIVLTHPMVLLGDEAQVEARFFPFGDSANLDARYVHGLCRMYHKLRNYFGHSRWNS
jgi:hypothetical protein